MNKMMNTGVTGRKPKYLTILAVIICGVAVNLLGSFIAEQLSIKLFLDSIGTVIASILGGALPGICVGLITNFSKSYSDPTSLFYATLNVLIAVCSSGFARRGMLKRFRGYAVLIFPLAFIGGFVGSILTWFLYGFSEESLAIPFIRDMYEDGKISSFRAQIATDTIIDLYDKAITIVIAYVVIRLLSDEIKNKLYFAGWCQTPLSSEVLKMFRSRKCREVSLRGKLILMITVSLSVVAALSIGISSLLFKDINRNNHESIAENTAALASKIIDPDMVDDYIEEGRSAPGYDEIERMLYDLRDSNEGVEYIYIYRIDEEGCHVVFDLDGIGDDEEKADPPGLLVPYDDSIADHLEEFLKGEKVDSLITDDEYGWLMTLYEPVYNDKGECLCYVCVDIDMTEIKADSYQFIAKQVSLFLGFFILMLETGLWLVEYHIILPVNSMAYSADRFAYNDEGAIEDNVSRIRRLNIQTGDEIENLYQAFTKTTEDTVKYMSDIRAKNETITRMQNGLIIVLADIVESRDKSTGNHIKMTAAYVDIILRRMKEKGLYPDILTEDYILDVVHSAPLHDIGKIQVPDAVLNKPGKLTDEEYEQMKQHTTAGAMIIEQAMTKVSSTEGYLIEARNLALCHHEKWDGTGYPAGLKGEQIPLSARVMAVADVFDALTSKRVYKPSMPIEKVMEIIREGSGTHFDPDVVAAFEESIDRVKAALEGEEDTSMVWGQKRFGEDGPDTKTDA